MTLEVLLSCMHQEDDSLVHQSGITGDVVVINQCSRTDYREYPTQYGLARMYSTTERGLTRSRNMAIREARGDVCLICDDDECFVPDYAQRILQAYRDIPDADIIFFKMTNRKPSFPDRKLRLRFPLTMKVSSWQMSFRRDAILKSGVRFDVLMGAGSGNGAEEELKFLRDCEKAGLKMFYVPVEIGSVAQTHSTWFFGFTEEYFENRGATTRYIMGWPLASAYAVYYVLHIHKLYRGTITPAAALRATFRGIREDKLTKQAKAPADAEPPCAASED